MPLCDEILTAIFILFSTWLYNYYLTFYYCTITKLKSIKCGQSVGQKDYQNNP